MFKFLFGKKSIETVKETQRETVVRALGELNDVLGAMTVRSKIAVNLETGLIEIELPEQMPDEALALPAPKPGAEKTDPAPEPEAKADPAEDAKPAEADAKPADAPTEKAA